MSSAPPFPRSLLPRPPAPTLLDDDEQLADATIRIEAAARTRPILLQMSGIEAGRVRGVPPGASTLGRAEECSHRFDGGSLSRVHARIVRSGEAIVVEDAGSRNGVFVNDRRVARATLEDGDRLRLGSAVTLRYELVDEAEESLLCRLFDSSVRDGLTGAFNRAHLDERLAAEIAFAARHGAPLSVLMLDLDFFKRVNDTLGHLAGDEVLRATAATVRKTLRAEDVLARYGGEEFVVIARGIDLGRGAALAERLRSALERTAVPYQGTSISRTISAGVASLACCGDDRTPARLIAIADERLYRAKQAGRNRVVAG